ncbi:MAG: hypothetical protein ACXW4P_29990 [Thermoanaerobaculia bacterium]
MHTSFARAICRLTLAVVVSLVLAGQASADTNPVSPQAKIQPPVGGAAIEEPSLVAWFAGWVKALMA